LIAIWHYGCAQWGETQADQYAEQIEAAAISLCEFPMKTPEALIKGKRFRKWVSGRHVLIFRVEKNSVNIARVLHVLMDHPRHLN
jgi:plasmid stabilization system protein ParE